MKNRPHRQPIAVTALQSTCVVIIAACVLLLTSEQVSDTVGAQGCSTPPSGTMGGGTWAHNSSIQVRVDSNYPESDRAALAGGTVKWHGGNCSGVTFHGFQSLAMPNYAEIPPNFHLWFQRDDPRSGYNAGVFKSFGPQVIGQPGAPLVAVRIKIKPGLSNTSVPHYFVYLGTHEVGHTLGIDNCDGCLALTSIMGGQSNSDNGFNDGGPTQCDQAAVNQVYCPTPTPTPTPPTPTPTPAPHEVANCEANGGTWNFTHNSCDDAGGGEYHPDCPWCFPWQVCRTSGCSSPVTVRPPRTLLAKSLKIPSASLPGQPNQSGSRLPSAPPGGLECFVGRSAGEVYL